MRSMASMARFAPSWSDPASNSGNCLGTTCQETPNRSFSQPH
jgi:hypothetical protein